MHLEIKEVERFYNIWFPLLHYVNQKKKLVPSFPAKWQNANVDPKTAFPLRNALWEDDSLREAFIQENPAGLPASDLLLVASWQHRVAGDFFIFRYLKKYTVLLSEAPARAYGVLGITGPIEDIIGPYLPIYIQAVLLPFDGRIIYDSLLSPYPIYFGGGIRSSLKDTYRNIQEREGIITNLLPDAEANSPENIRKGIQERNKKVLTAFQKYLGQSGLSPKKIEEHTTNVADFSQKILLSQETPHGLLELTLDNLNLYMETQPGKARLISLKRFVRFLRDTYRIDYYAAEEYLDFLK